MIACHWSRVNVCAAYKESVTVKIFADKGDILFVFNVWFSFLCSGLVLVREDHVLDDLLPGETREFVNRGIIPMTVCRDYFTQRLQRYPVSAFTSTNLFLSTSAVVS